MECNGDGVGCGNCSNCCNESYWGDEDDSIDDEDGDSIIFADPNGNSAIRASSKSNPRNLPCPSCGTKNVLTPADRACGYQCNRCADRAEGGGYGYGEY